MMTENPQDPPADGDPTQQPYSGQPYSGQPYSGQPYSGQPYSGQPTDQGPGPGQWPAYGYPAQPPVSPADARMWSLFAHLGGMFLSFMVPLVIYLVYKDRDPFIRGHSAQALNFHITIFIVYFVSIPLMLIGIGFLTFLAAAICAVVFSIIAAVAANAGNAYAYPMTPSMIT